VGFSAFVVVVVVFVVVVVVVLFCNSSEQISIFKI
jgi:hypothetical protein